MKRALSTAAVAFLVLSVTVATAPSARAASPLEKAVFFLGDVGVRLSSASRLPARSGLGTASRRSGESSRGGAGLAEAQDTGAAEPEGGEQNRQQKHEVVIYVVESGDTLSQIAESFNISVSTITGANDITSRSTLRIGQELRILPVDGVEHTIVRGETLSHIAGRYKADVDEIITFNNIQDEKRIRPGETVIVPGANVSPARATLASAITSPAPPTAPSAAPADVPGYFVAPVVGGITQGLHFLNAVDMGGSQYCGTPVRAAAEGTVVTSAAGGWNGGYGNYVKIHHPNGTDTIYAHNASNTVVPGQGVAQGEIIGYMGSTGNSTGCHVHFGVRGAANPFAGL